jgi:hypothetical protein
MWWPSHLNPPGLALLPNVFLHSIYWFILKKRACGREQSFQTKKQTAHRPNACTLQCGLWGSGWITHSRHTRDLRKWPALGSSPSFLSSTMCNQTPQTLPKIPVFLNNIDWQALQNTALCRYLGEPHQPLENTTHPTKETNQKSVWKKILNLCN